MNLESSELLLASEKNIYEGFGKLLTLDGSLSVVFQIYPSPQVQWEFKSSDDGLPYEQAIRTNEPEEIDGTLFALKKFFFKSRNLLFSDARGICEEATFGNTQANVTDIYRKVVLQHE